MGHYKHPPITVAKQFHALKQSTVGEGSIKNGMLEWDFIVRPTPLSDEYLLRLRYKLRDSPNIYVLSPDIKKLANGRQIPHLYNQDKLKLCLYLPGSGEWNNKMYLSNTIAPWASLWLFFFEEWLFSNVWKGGGVHPVSKSTHKSNKKNKKRRNRK